MIRPTAPMRERFGAPELEALAVKLLQPIAFRVEDDQFSRDLPRRQRGSGTVEAIGQCTYVSDVVGPPNRNESLGIWSVTVHVSTTGEWWENCTVNGTWKDPWGEQDSDGAGQFLAMICP